MPCGGDELMDRAQGIVQAQASPSAADGLAMSTSTSVAPDPFAAVLGAKRGAQRTPWEELSSAEQDRTVGWHADYCLRLYWRCGNADSTPLRLDPEVVVHLAPLRAHVEDETAFVSAAAPYRPALLTSARQQCTEWWWSEKKRLSCGHGPTVTASGAPGVVAPPFPGAVGGTQCHRCFDAERLAAFADAEDRFVAVAMPGRLSSRNADDGLVLAVLDEQHQAANGLWYWRATDIHGRKWHGCCGAGGGKTIMRRSKQ